MARYMRSYGKSTLRPPAVVAGPSAPARPLTVKLVRLQTSPRRASWALRGPTVVNPLGTAQIGPPVLLAPQRRGHALSVLRPPTVVLTPGVSRPLDVTLAPGRRGHAAPVLRQPAVIGAGIVFAAVQVHRAASRRGQPKPSLRPPAVVATGVVFAPVSVQTAYSRRGAPTSTLAAPAAVGNGIVFSPLTLHTARPPRTVTRSALRPPILTAATSVPAPIKPWLTRTPLRRQTSWLRGPTVINPAAVAQIGPSTILAPKPRPGRALTALHPPTVLGSPPSRPLDVTLARSSRGVAKARLAAPTAVGNPVAYHGPGVKLAWRANYRQPVSHRLSPPVAVTVAVLAPVAVTLAPGRRGKASSRLTAPPIGSAFVAPRGTVKLAQPPRQTRAPRARLVAPVVVGAAIVFRGPGVRLVAPINTRARVRHVIGAPAVVATGVLFAPITTSLAYQRRGHATYRLAAPASVGGGIAYHGPGVKIAATPNRRPAVKHTVGAPVVVTAAPLANPLRIRLAPSRRGTPKPRLQPPTTIAGPISFHGPGVRLAAPANTRRPVRHTLAPPAAVGQIAAYHGPGVKLVAPINARQPVTHRLAAPAVVAPPPAVRPAKFTLAPQKRGRPLSTLSPPATVGASITYHGPGVRLVTPLTTRRPVRHVLSPPVVVGVLYAFHGPGVRLAGPVDTRQPVRHRLSAPTVVAPPVVYAAVTVTLAASTRGVPQARLSPPAAVAGGMAFHGPRVRLVSPVNARAAVQHRLAPPSLVRLIVFAPITVTLAASSRGTAKPTLSAPALIGGGHAFHGPRVLLAPSTDITTRRRPDSRLRPPAAVQPLTLLFFGPDVTRAPSSRGKPAHRLAPPTIVGAGVTFKPVSTHLAPSFRGRPQPILSPPTVVGSAPFRGLDITTVRIRPARTVAILHAPAVVRQPPFRPADITLARIRPAAVHPRLRAALTPPPTQAQSTLTVTIAPSRRPTRFYRLRPPTRIGAGIVFRPIQTHTVRITHPPVNRMLGAPTAIITVSPCHGHISDHPPYGGHSEDHGEHHGHVVDATKAGGMIQDVGTSTGLVSDSSPAHGQITDKQQGT